MRLFDSALADVTYQFGNPLPFIPDLVARLHSRDRQVRGKAQTQAFDIANRLNTVIDEDQTDHARHDSD